MPIAQVHAVVLANPEILLLLRADYVLGQIAQQSPVVELSLPGLHQIVIRRAIQAKGQQTKQRLLGEYEDPPRLEDPFDFQEHLLHLHELAQHLEREDYAQGAVFEWQINCIAGHADWRPRETPAVHERDAVAQRVGRDIQGESFSSKIISKQVTGVPGI